MKPFSKKPVKNPIRLSESQVWEEEFEGNLYQYCHSEYILDLLHKYSVDNKVKIKARKGKIVIERII